MSIRAGRWITLCALLAVPAAAAGQTSSFPSEWYASSLAQLGEPGTHDLPPADEEYRAVWLRSFDEPIVVRVVRRGTSYSVITAQGTRRDSVALSFDRWDLLHRRGAMEEFWSDSVFEGQSRRGLDGAHWILEGQRGSEYQIRDWWSPREDTEGAEGRYRRFFLEILSLGSACVSPQSVY